MKELFKKFTKLIYPLMLTFFVLYIFGATGTGPIFISVLLLGNFSGLKFRYRTSG